jgi:DNA polymerase II small subunit/DNA polymerase delta subunit B
MFSRLNEMAQYAEKHGRDAAAKHFGITKESIKRNLRKVKNKSRKQQPIDEHRQTLIERIAERYTDKELKALLDESFRPQSLSTEYNFSGESIKIGVLSDPHIGSKYTDESRVTAALEEMKRQGVKLVVMPGDLTEGMSGRDGHIYELKHIGYQAQRDAVVRLIEPFTKHMSFKMISGNHDLWFAQKANMGALIVKDICDILDNCEYIGEHEGTVWINGVDVRLWHGGDGASYALSYRSQKIIESLSGGEKPGILITGHDHKQGYFFIRNIHAFSGGCIQSQSQWMRGKKIAAHCGFWILEPTIKDAEIKRMKSEFIPFYV